MGNQEKQVECCIKAIERIEAADSPLDHVDAHADALDQIGGAHFTMKEWQECIARSEESVTVRESTHGRDHPLVVVAPSQMASAYENLGNLAKGRVLIERVVEIQTEAQGRLSKGNISFSFKIGSICIKEERYVEARDWLKLTVEVSEFWMGKTHPDTKKFDDTYKTICVMCNCDARLKATVPAAEAAEEAETTGYAVAGYLRSQYLVYRQCFDV
jgi:hypothetical protein